MIFRTYGRRSRSMSGGYSGASSFGDGVSDSSSQECPQDIYDFAFQSQDSSRCHWSDPYSFTSSQESRQMAFLPPRKGGGFGGGFRESKKMKVIEVNSGPYGSSLSQESKEFSVVEISEGDFKKSKKPPGKVVSDPFDYDSSQELEDFVVRPQRKAREDKVFDFSENGVLWKPSKNVDLDSLEFNSSQELKDLVVRPQRKAREDKVFDFSENGILWKPSKNVDLDSFEFNSSQELGDLGIPQSRKKENNGYSREFDGGAGKSKKDNRVLPKKKKKNKAMMKSKDSGQDYIELTSTLMETQEFGEMMEHVDEVNFALDGLKKGPVRVRRASLLSLLSICGTAQQRRLLRVQGMAKTIIDAVLGLSFDDKPSNLAAAALFYILTSDGQDDNLLDSPKCIRFLIKLLKPLSSSAAKEKVLPVGSKLLALCKNAGLLQESAKGTDTSSSEISIKVQEILVSCKEMKPRDASDDGIEEPELNPKWISLLTMEKACLSRVSIEDTSGALRKNGAHFKEKLREFGGLDAVFETARKCHSVMEEWKETSPSFTFDLKDTSGLESLAVLLKCLRIMENATFLSNNNQCHLLRMKGNFDGQQAPRSFVKLVLSVIKILSGVSLLRSSLGSSQDEKMGRISYGSSLEPSQASIDPLLIKWRVESSQAGSCSGTSWNSNNVACTGSDDSEMEIGLGKRRLRSTNIGAKEDSEDPFAFHADEFEPSKWEILYGDGQKPLSQDSRPSVSGYKDGSQFVEMPSQQESNNMEYHRSQGTSCSSAVDEKSNLLADCLLTAVKVLMNLTNDNPEGCKQIANYGGLEILSSLIAGHFPSFGSSFPHIDDLRGSNLSSKSSRQSNIALTDQELDFLVAILGLLVNLVEKDSRNRSRLAEASVSLPRLEGVGLKERSNVISLLCSIFLANQGTSEAGGEEKYLSWDDEDSILQGEKEAEKMIVEAYAALLLAFLSTESKSIRNNIAEYLPNHNLRILVPVLERFVEFHLTLNMISPETHTAVLEVIESCRIP